MAQGTLQSIWDKLPASNITLGFLDLGCTPEQQQWLQAHEINTHQIEWPFAFPNQEKVPEYIKGFVARPYLRQYFPNFDIYIWIDADAWVQEWRAIELFIQGAERRGLAIVPEVNRASSILYGGVPQNHQWAYFTYEANYGDEIAKKYHTYPVLNAGVFALHKEATHWEIWVTEIKRAVIYSASRNRFQMGAQTALNFAIYSSPLFK